MNAHRVPGAPVATVERFFDSESADWTGHYESRGLFGRRYEIIVDLIDRHVGHSGRVLDAGCGSGVFAAFLANRGLDVVAVDSAPEMLRLAERHVSDVSRRTHGTVTFTRSRIEELVMKPEAFDVILCLSVLEYVDPDERVLEAFSNALVRGGTLMLSVPNARSAVRMLERAVHRLRPDRSLYLDYQLHQYAPSDVDVRLSRLGLVKRAGAYWSVGVDRPRVLVAALERRPWAAMYGAVYVKDGSGR